MADRTGLEPATSAVTGQRSNQLSYRSVNIPTIVNNTFPRTNPDASVGAPTPWRRS